MNPSLQFFDGYFTQLPPGTYTLTVQHVVETPSGKAPFSAPTQQVVVQAPEFTLPAGTVQSFYPPDGASGSYGADLPYVVLADPALPWERQLDPTGEKATPAAPVPWLAVVLFAGDEIYLQPGTSSPIATCTVADLLAPSTTVLKPTLPDGWVTSDVLASQCATITITGAAWNAVMPYAAELPLLAHCQNDGTTLMSAVIGNRLATAASGPVRYYAHLVSLEGFAAYLAGTPLPTQPGSSALVDVQLVSLCAWSFTSTPEVGLDFAQLAAGLVASETATAGLALPIPAGQTPPAAIVERLTDGYAPLGFDASPGHTFAWYRGPLTPVVPQPLPPVGSAAVDVGQATTADALVIYLAEQGVFDLSYAAAWNLGRGLALADGAFTAALDRLRTTARATLGVLAQRGLGDADDARVLGRRDAMQSAFGAAMERGLGEAWTDALASARAGRRGVRAARPRRRGVDPRALIGRPDVTAALADSVADDLAIVEAWLAQLAVLAPVPFSHLVPDPRMLPVESIRFFYVDPTWIAALSAGALSLGLQGSVDVAIDSVLRPRCLSAPPGLAGVVVRSQMIEGWPGLVIAGSSGGNPLAVVRDAVLAPSVRLCLFAGVPDTVTLTEPYLGLQFGVEDGGVVIPRAVTQPAAAGYPLAGATAVTVAERTPPAGAIGGVVDVTALAADLAAATGVSTFAADATVTWNGTALPTTWVAGNVLTATVDASYLTSAGTAQIAVVSGGVTSEAAATFTIGTPAAAAADDDAPAITVISPLAAAAGGAAFTLTVDGTGFDADAAILWNGTALDTTFDDSGQLTAEVTTDLLTAGTAAITVSSGGQVSPAASLYVVGAGPVVSLLQPASAAVGAAGFPLTVIGGFGPGSLAMQLVIAPERQSFQPA